MSKSFLGRAAAVILSILTGAAAIAAPTSQGIGSSTGTGSDRKEQAAQRSRAISEIAAAVKALQAEFEAHLKDTNAPLRDKSNYFTPESSADLTPELVVDAVSRNYGASNGEACYVRWQLLSYFDPAGDASKRPMAQLGILYARAPFPDPHPSLQPAVRSLLDRETSHMAATQVDGFNQQWSGKVADWAANNKPILAYTDLLYKLLPDSYGKFKLGWSDLFDKRVQAGVAVADTFTTMEPQITAWAAKATPVERKNFVSLIKQTIESLKRNTPTVYGSATYDDSARRTVIAKNPVSCPNTQALTDLATAVTNGTDVPKTK